MMHTFHNKKPRISLTEILGYDYFKIVLNPFHSELNVIRLRR
jgi:hypothetical protein